MDFLSPFLFIMGQSEEYLSIKNERNEIPTMVSNKVRSLLTEYAGRIKENQSAVEIGPWLGACTVAILKGLPENRKLHVYGNFTVSEREYEKALEQGLDLHHEKISDAFDRFTDPHIKPGCELHKYICDIINAKYSGCSIGLYVDDAAKKKKCFDHMIRTFFPYFIKGTILFLMDYFFYEKKGKHSKEYEYQKNYMTKHSDRFRFVSRPDHTSAAIFEVIR